MRGMHVWRFRTTHPVLLRFPTWKKCVQPANTHGILCCQGLLVIVSHLVSHIPEWHRPKNLPSSGLSDLRGSSLQLPEAAQCRPPGMQPHDMRHVREDHCMTCLDAPAGNKSRETLHHS